MAESSFWSVNSVAVEPAYVPARELLRHIVEAVLRKRATQSELGKLRAATAVLAGFILCGLAIFAFIGAWPTSRWVVDSSNLIYWRGVIRIALANSIVLGTAYLAVASLAWAFADASMPQPRDLDEFYVPPGEGRIWRIAHLSDIHVVGERYGFRIESGPIGPARQRPA